MVPPLMAARPCLAGPSMTASTSSSFMSEVLLAVERNLFARILAKEDPVTRFDVEGDPLAGVCRLPVAGGDDRALLRLFLGGIWNDDPAHSLFGFVEALNHNAVVQRSQMHALFSVALVPS